jgi:hypothetical protein
MRQSCSVLLLLYKKIKNRVTPFYLPNVEWSYSIPESEAEPFHSLRFLTKRHLRQHMVVFGVELCSHGQKYVLKMLKLDTFVSKKIELGTFLQCKINDQIFF